MSRALEFHVQGQLWNNLRDLIWHCITESMKIALDQELAFWTLICKEISWAKDTAWFWKGKPGWELGKTPS